MYFTQYVQTKFSKDGSIEKFIKILDEQVPHSDISAITFLISVIIVNKQQCFQALLGSPFSHLPFSICYGPEHPVG